MSASFWDCVNADRAADEQLTAHELSLLEYGDPAELQAMLGDCSDDELIAWIEIAKGENHAASNY